MAPTVTAVLADARSLSKQIEDEDDAIAKLALLSPDAALDAKLVSFSRGLAAFSLPKTADVFKGAKRAFEHAKKLVKKIVCDDLKFCARAEAVSTWLNRHLPDIVRRLLQGAPGGIVRKILGLLGLATTSWAAVVSIVVAWLIKAGLEKLCNCP